MLSNAEIWTLALFVGLPILTGLAFLLCMLVSLRNRSARRTIRRY